MDDEHIEYKFEQLEQEIKQLKADAKAREVAQLRMGIRVLGIVVIGMAGWIWTQIGSIFDTNIGGQK